MLKYFNYDIVFQEIPDEVTLAINLSNCPNRCEGCHSPHLTEDVGEVLTKDVLADLLSKYGKAITCVCFMGGDAAPLEVVKLAEYILYKNCDIKVGWYSGRDELPIGFTSEPFTYIKLGPYIEQYGGLSCKTTNQRLYKIHDGQLFEDITCRFEKS
ncbi:MAG: anaerobic ribonucleoside-triphosphate reductase activating protein [Bacteroidetes bacterium GWF2_40_14]|nr:MAG: anaerobic ribonucleoside-triphosphate reductase activating protein [Bacteroidetes bacterium GWF2_40_14]